jgi:ketosteroid isomerase-like protein
MSENLDLVRSIHADRELRDFSRSDWAHPEIEFVLGDGPDPGESHGVAVMAQRWRGQLRPWEDLAPEAVAYRELDNERVLVLVRLRGRGKTTGVEVHNRGANLFHVREGKVTRLVLYWDRDRALADLGVEG